MSEEEIPTLNVPMGSIFSNIKSFVTFNGLVAQSVASLHPSSAGRLLSTTITTPVKSGDSYATTVITEWWDDIDEVVCFTTLRVTWNGNIPDGSSQ